jgi:hypothetical protein
MFAVDEMGEFLHRCLGRLDVAGRRGGAVPQQIADRGVPGKGLGHLAR